ncbi:hypothetical protein [Symbiobacterium terraclitae]|uniref:hypothetical protein n=1 Tax=Symbiobacterium terraclitae TaxID=557451 RepID=UPI0035B545DC
MQIQLPLTLRPNPMKWIFVMVLMAAMAAGGLWLWHEEPLPASVAVVFGLLGALAAAVQMLPNASYLRLTPEGFTFCSLFRSHTVAWSDVTEFYVLEHRGNGHKLVGWHYAPHYAHQLTLRIVNDNLIGVEAALPDTYGMDAYALADLMAELQQAYGKRPDEEPSSASAAE